MNQGEKKGKAFFHPVFNAPLFIFTSSLLKFSHWTPDRHAVLNNTTNTSFHSFVSKSVLYNIMAFDFDILGM